MVTPLRRSLYNSIGKREASIIHQRIKRTLTGRKMARLNAQKRIIVLIPFSFQGHMTPMLQLGGILHSKGFSIIVAHTEFNSPNPSNHPEFLFLPLADGLSSYDTSFPNMLSVIKAINNNCRGPLVEYLAQLMKEPEIFGHVSCIIYDFILGFGDAVATHLSLPSIVFRTGSAGYMHSYHAILQLNAEGYFPLPESQLHDPVPGLHHLRFKDLPLSSSTKISDAMLEHFAYNIDIGNSVAIIWNTTEELEHLSLTQLQLCHEVPFFPIGPIHVVTSTSSSSFFEEDKNCMMWLDKQAPNSVLYISLGSLATIDEKELEETAWGLANSGQPFLWVVRPSLVNGSQWNEKLPEGFREVVRESGQIVKWAPQKEVLAHSAVGGFFSHCGWNSTLESMCEGVPMICRPCFGDQLVNARYLSHIWKAGLELENAKDRVVIERTIRKLMLHNEGREIRQRMLVMKQKVETSVQNGGCSYRSLNELTEFISSFPCPNNIVNPTLESSMSYGDL